MFKRYSNEAALKYVNKDRSNAVKVIVFILVLLIAGGGILWYSLSVMSSNQERRRSGFVRPVDEVASTYEPTSPRSYPESDTIIVIGTFDEIITDPETDHVIAAFGGVSYHRQLGGQLELPIYGATGWAAVNTSLRESPANNAATIMGLNPGDGFTILSESGNWWHVQIDNTIAGWVDVRACFINLPDVIPSIVYNIVNARSSIFRSSGYDIPGVSSLQLYNAWAYNPRFGREMYIVPAKYPLALSLFQAQLTALENGNTIILYEAFRPRATQATVVAGMRELMSESYAVRTNIEGSGWSLGWFISTGVSNHQRGAAIDISIGTIRDYEYRRVGDFIYRHILEQRPHIMPSRMHELSQWAAIFDLPRSSTMAQLTNGSVNLTENARLDGIAALHQAIAGAGNAFTPLASEWWHFDHTASISSADSVRIQGELFTETVYSWKPIMHTNE